MAWAFLTRAGSERDLIDELGRKHDPRPIGDGVVLAESRPRGPDGSFVELAFARQAMRAEGEASADVEGVVEAIVAAMKARRTKKRGAKPWTWALQIVAPDSSDPHDARRKVVRNLEEAELERRVVEALPKAMADQRVAVDAAERLVQAWPVDAADLLIGVTPATHVLSRSAGGKVRLKRPDDAPSRSGLKLDEAIGWIGVGPERGDLVADLGAAPGGWTKVALGRGATVIAIDPARMKIEAPKKRFEHLAQSAFDFAPEETLDWVLCDMAWRPVEVAKLLAKWGRRSWARQLFVNFKLPMKTKHKVLADALAILREAGWEGLRARQLYHDRDEVTVFGWLNAGLVARGALAPFELRSAGKKAQGRVARGRGGARGQTKRGTGRGSSGRGSSGRGSSGRGSSGRGSSGRGSRSRSRRSTRKPRGR